MSDTVVSMERTGAVLTIEENVIQGGYGQAVRQSLAEQSLGSIPVRILGLPDAFIEHGSQAGLRNDAGLSIEGVCQAARELVKARR